MAAKKPNILQAEEGGDVRRPLIQGASRRPQPHVLLKGEEKESPRLYWSDDGDPMAIRVRHWTATFMTQDHTGLDVWKQEFTDLRAPNLYNLRADPFERDPESFEYGRWIERAFLIVPAQAIAAKWLESFKEFPPRQSPRASASAT